MSDFFFDSFENIDQLWKFYWGLGALVWFLVWLGLRRWMWWGLTSLILGITAGLIVTLARTDVGGGAPATMLAALAFLSKSDEPLSQYLKLIAVTSIAFTSIFIIFHLALDKLRALISHH